MAAPFHRNRYDPDDLVGQLSRQQPKLVAGRWEFTLEAPIGEIGVDLPDLDGSCSRPALAVLFETIRHIREMDNLVQESCEEQFRRSNLEHMHFTLGIGWIPITDENLTDETVALTYYGLGVNTMWDAQFKREPDGHWRKLNF